MVVGRPSERWGQEVVALVALREGTTADQTELQELCTTQLARFKVPEEYLVVEALPKTSIGKIEKKALRQQLAPEKAGGV